MVKACSGRPPNTVYGLDMMLRLTGLLGTLLPAELVVPVPILTWGAAGCTCEKAWSARPVRMVKGECEPSARLAGGVVGVVPDVELDRVDVAATKKFCVLHRNGKTKKNPYVFLIFNADVMKRSLSTRRIGLMKSNGYLDNGIAENRTKCAPADALTGFFAPKREN